MEKSDLLVFISKTLKAKKINNKEWNSLKGEFLDKKSRLATYEWLERAI